MWHYLCDTVQTSNDNYSLFSLQPLRRFSQPSKHKHTTCFNSVLAQLHLLIALFSPFIVLHIYSNEHSRNGRFTFSASRELFRDRVYACCHACLSLMLIVVVQMFDVFVSVYGFVYTQTLVDVDDLSVTISRHLSVLVDLCSCCFSFCLLLLM